MFLEGTTGFPFDSHWIFLWFFFESVKFWDYASIARVSFRFVVISVSIFRFKFRSLFSFFFSFLFLDGRLSGKRRGTQGLRARWHCGRRREARTALRRSAVASAGGSGARRSLQRRRREAATSVFIFYFLSKSSSSARWCAVGPGKRSHVFCEKWLTNSPIKPTKTIWQYIKHFIGKLLKCHFKNVWTNCLNILN